MTPIERARNFVDKLEAGINVGFDDVKLDLDGENVRELFSWAFVEEFRAVLLDYEAWMEATYRKEPLGADLSVERYLKEV